MLGANILAGKIRPVIAKFHYFHERERVRSTSWTLKEDHKKANVGVGVQIPKEWREFRKALSTVYQEEKP